MASGTSLTYQWRKNGTNIGGANAASYSINNVSSADAGNYDVVVGGTCGNATSAIAILTVNQPGSWIGVISTNWNTAGNWCGAVPTPGSDVIITAGAPFMPNLSAANGSARHITINSGASLTIGAGGNLDIYGNLVNNGTFNAGAGNLGFRGSAPQSIAAFTTTNVSMNGSGGITLSGSAFVTGALSLLNGHITLGANSISLSSGSNGSLASHIITNASGLVVMANLGASTSRKYRWA